MKRRTFIWTPILLSLGLSTRLNAHTADAFVSDQLNDSDYHILLQRFRDPSDAAEVGRRYLADKPELPDVDHLIRDLGVATPNTQREDASERFDAAKRHDFTIGNTVCIEGWVLSKAEASLCALAYLEQTTFERSGL